MAVKLQTDSRDFAFLTTHKGNLTPKKNLQGLDAIAIAARVSSDTEVPTAALLRTSVTDYLQKAFTLDFVEQFKSWPDFTGKPGEMIEIPLTQDGVQLRRIYIVGVGNALPQDYRKAGVALGRKVKSSGKSLLVATLPTKKQPSKSEQESALLHCVALILSSYSWTMKAKAPGPLSHFAISGNYGAQVDRANLLGQAVWHARDLIHTPSNIKNPAWMASQAHKLVASTKNDSLSVEVLSGKALTNFGGLVAIGNSAPKPGPRFIKVSYAPKGSKNWPHVVLVGKGITYDTGGISLKRPYDIMQPMKSDMSGAAAVLATTVAMAELNPRVRVTALLMCAENALSATSARPSDVITQYDGTTVEINNTDAEGRLVLADGLGYAVKHLKPTYLIDVATLTGAATLGLSRQYGAMYGRNNKLMKSLSAIGERIGDRVWQLPLVEDYRDALASDVADLCHTADKVPVGAGSITAALFLEHFAKESNWVHLDIAGPARADNDAGENIKGGTGFGVRLLIEWIATL